MIYSHMVIMPFVHSANIIIGTCFTDAMYLSPLPHKAARASLRTYLTSPPDQQTTSRVKLQHNLAKEALGLLRQERGYMLNDL